MRFTSQHKAINQKEYGKAVSPLRFDSLALILSWSIFVVYGKQSEKNKYICSSKRHSALHTFGDTTAKSQHICFKCARMALRATFSCERGLRRFAMEPPFWNYSSPSGLLLAFALVGYCLH